MAENQPNESLPNTEEIVERAIESVLDQVPDLPDSDIPEANTTRAQPWADTATTPGKNKKPIEDLLAEFAERIAADPDAKASAPTEKPAQEMFFERFSQPAPGTGRKRRRRSRGRRGGAAVSGSAQPSSPAPARPASQPSTNGGTANPARRRRRRRGRGGRGPGSQTPTSVSSLGEEPVRAVLFDFNCTLATFARPNRELELAYEKIVELLDKAGVDPVPAAPRLLSAIHDVVDARIATNSDSETLEEVDHGALVKGAYSSLGIELDSQMLDEVIRIEQEAWQAGVIVDEEVIPTLRKLHELGLRLGLCSNAPYRPSGVLALIDHAGIAPLLDSITLSSQVGWRKPAPRMFAAAMAALGSSAQETIMVGDSSKEDVVGGKAAGMRVVRMCQYRDDRPPGDDADAILDNLSELPHLIASVASTPANSPV